MRFWSLMVLTAWLIAGLLAAPAMAFGMKCHGSMTATSISEHALHAGDGEHAHHAAVPRPGKEMQEKLDLVCAAHCLSACAVFAIAPAFDAAIVTGSGIRPHFYRVQFEGSPPGPPLEPPISL